MLSRAKAAKSNITEQSVQFTGGSVAVRVFVRYKIGADERDRERLPGFIFRKTGRKHSILCFGKCTTQVRENMRKTRDFKGKNALTKVVVFAIIFDAPPQRGGANFP
jgi:hypothetical protein